MKDNEIESNFEVINKFWDVGLELKMELLGEEDEDLHVTTGVTFKEPKIFDHDTKQYIGGRTLSVQNDIIVDTDNINEENELNLIVDMLGKTLNEILNSEALNVSFDTMKYAELMDEIKLREMEFFE